MMSAGLTRVLTHVVNHAQTHVMNRVLIRRSLLGYTGRLRMTRDAVLLVTASYDVAPEYVGASLDRMGVPYFRLDTDRFPAQIQATYDPNIGVTFSDDDQSIRGEQIRSVWYRRMRGPLLPSNLDCGTRDFCERENRAFLEGVLASLPTDRWLSLPTAVARAERKPYQLGVAKRLGFDIPATVMTNDEIVVRAAAKRHQLVAKAVSSGYVRNPEGNRAIFTSAVSQDDVSQLDGLSMAPVTFQEMVKKVSDIRVTVVGEDVFAAEIMSQDRESSRVDWRATDDPHLEHRRHELPHEVADLCRQLLATLGLGFGAIDFALTGDGSYVFFEINPNGEWLWIEDQLGLPISDAIARILGS